MTPRTAVYDDQDTFAAAVSAPLAARAVGNNTFIGVLERMGPSPKHLRTAVWSGDELLLAGLCTAPYILNLAHPGRGVEGTRALAEELTARKMSLPGVVSDTPVAEAFAQAWTGLNPVRADAGHRHLLYQADEVIHPAGISGSLRLASSANAERHVDWESAFGVDVAVPEAMRERSLVAERVNRWLAGDVLFDWVVDGAAVAHGVVQPIGNDGARVLAIYTPPEMRGRGYAQAMTAALTQSAFDQGRWCTLFTDADNPITNKIYPRVGYRFLWAYTDFVFVPA